MAESFGGECGERITPEDVAAAQDEETVRRLQNEPGPGEAI